MSQKIEFFRPTSQYGFLSNFFLSDFYIDQILYKTVEHWFQSNKTFDTYVRQNIIDCPTPYEAKRLAGNKKYTQLRPDWEVVKEQIMYQGLKEKFLQNRTLNTSFMLFTVDTIFVEKSPYDSEWGCGADGTGKNKLGKLLSKLRKELENL